MTRWIPDPEGGRERGPRALGRAWLEVMVRPRRFFRDVVSPGDQAPGLTFLVAVVLVAATTRFLLVPDAYPSLPVARPLVGLFWIGFVALLVAPLGLHFVAGLQTLCLIAFVPNRSGISETVQVIAYSSAPCVVAGVPIPALRALAAAYAVVLLLVGLRSVHETSAARAVAAGTVPAAIVYGYAFGGFAALAAVGVGDPF